MLIVIEAILLKMYFTIYSNNYGHILDFEAEGRIRIAKHEIDSMKIISWSNKGIGFLCVVSYFRGMDNLCI